MIQPLVRWLRISLYFLPLLLIVLAYYFVASMARTEREAVDPDAITFAITTVPIGIDPLTQQDPISEEIESLLFDRLLGRSPEMKLEGRLAENWSYGSTARYFFRSQEHRDHWLKELGNAKARWHGWGIERISPDGEIEILVDFNTHHTNAKDELLGFFAKEDMAELIKWELQMKDSAAESVRSFAESAVEGWQVRRIKANSVNQAEFYTFGKLERFRREVAIYYDTKPELKPVLKEVGPVSYLFSTRMTMNLRNGVRWHDGKPFTVDDVMHSLSMAKDSQSQPVVTSALESIERIEPRRPLSFTVYYKKPIGRTLEMWEELPILPAHAVYFHVPNETGLPPLIGTGPFTIAEWEAERPIRLERNEDYFRGKPENQRFVYERVLEARMRRILFQINSIDSYEAKPTTYENLQNRENFDLVKSPPVFHTYIAWNLQKEVFADVRVREALAMAVDRQRMIDDLLDGNGELVDQLFHPGANIDSKVSPVPFDPEESIKLLESAGWNSIRYGTRHKDRTPLTFTLAVIGGDELQRDIARSLLSQWRRIGDKVGAQVQLHIASYAELSKLRHGNVDFDAALMTEPLTWSLDQYANWHSSEAGPGKGNFTSVKDQEVDRLLEALRATYDDSEARKLAGELQVKLLQLQPISPLFRRDSARVFQRDRAVVVDKSTKQGPVRREVGENRVSLTHDLAWWVKIPQEEPIGPAAILPPLNKP